MQNLFFLGIILVGKEKIQNKNTKTIQKQKNQSITFCCGDCGKKHGGGHSRAEGKGPEGSADSRQGCSREEPHKKKGWLRPKLQPVVTKEKGFRCFLQLRTQKNKNRNTCGLLKPHKLYQQNVLRSLKGFSDIFYFIVYFKVVFKTKHTEKQSLETDWLCVHRNTNTTRYVLVGLL